MKKEDELKELVKRRYDELALNSDSLKCGCCCGTAPAQPSQNGFTIMSEDYSRLNGYEPDADLGGRMRTTHPICPDQTRRYGHRPRIRGRKRLFHSPSRNRRGRQSHRNRLFPANARQSPGQCREAGLRQCRIQEGDIENMPVRNDTADVVVSNCVLNLLPRKDRIFKEIRRVLKPGGHFCVSDVVLQGIFPKEFTDNAAMYAGCIASAIQQEDYLTEIRKAGFADIQIERTKKIVIPERCSRHIWMQTRFKNTRPEMWESIRSRSRGKNGPDSSE